MMFARAWRPSRRKQKALRGVQNGLCPKTHKHVCNDCSHDSEGFLFVWAAVRHVFALRLHAWLQPGRTSPPTQEHLPAHRNLNSACAAVFYEAFAALPLPQGMLRCPLGAILYYTILYYTILYYTILYYTILHYSIYYIISNFYYNILYYIIIYYTNKRSDFPVGTNCHISLAPKRVTGNG